MRTALDVGCGVGYLSVFLRELGFEVIGADGREENIQEARRRYPEIVFHQANVEDESVERWGAFDLVFCVGLLYHLENPLLAIRRLHAITNRCLIVESMCLPGDRPWMLLREEPRFENQSLTDTAFYPTEGCLVKMLYRAGFSVVYRLASLPDFDDFQETPDHSRRRTVLLAAPERLPAPGIILLPEPPANEDPWTKLTPTDVSMLGRIKRFMGMSAREKYETVLRKLNRLIRFAQASGSDRGDN
jgi:SAM-dependent methyltransferase